MVFSDGSQTSSLVAGGLYNPVILKRFTAAWKAKEQLECSIPLYKALETRLEVPLVYEVPVLRRFASIEEQNSWFQAADQPVLCDFLSPHLLNNSNTGLDAPYGFGEVLHTGRVDTLALLNTYADFLTKENCLKKEPFHFKELEQDADGVSYGGVRAAKIVFATGYGLKSNPYFEYLPLNGTKGELLLLRIPGLKEERVIKSSAFIIPMGDDLYRVGATYKWQDKTNVPTVEAKEELLEKLSDFLTLPYEVKEHEAGIRPTVVDRRPLLGQHPTYKNMYVFNGMGSRGVMMAPWLAAQLVAHMEDGEKLLPETNIARFSKKYFKPGFY